MNLQLLDLRKYEDCLLATRGGVDQVYNLAADMGGIGYITAYLADISSNNVLINVNMLEASRRNAVKRFLFSSSACVYAQSKQFPATAIESESSATLKSLNLPSPAAANNLLRYEAHLDRKLCRDTEVGNAAKSNGKKRS